MNERVRQLVRQAGLDDADFPIENWDNVPLAKFAQLIVRECADFVREYPEKYLTHNQANEIGFGMEEHFGVES